MSKYAAEASRTSGMPQNRMPRPFHYETAFSRNLGWLTVAEQQELRQKTVAIAGLGGVGGVHLQTLARLGIGRFRIADLDRFELPNFNRQAGATVSTLGRPKVEVLAETAAEVNPEAHIERFPEGVTDGNLDRFLRGADLYVDGLDFFELEVRRRVFARCANLGIPAITAAPTGMGVAYLVFMPGGMTFEDYFRLDGMPGDEQQIRFLLGLAPQGFQRTYLVDPTRVNLAERRVPSTGLACQLCAGVAAAEAVKILLRRGPIRAAPCYQHFDAYLGKWARGRLRWGNRGPLQRFRLALARPIARRLARNATIDILGPAASDIERILDLARWAPSGDNSQPWRFEIIDADHVVVHVLHEPDNVYEYNDGEPTWMSVGFLVETMRIAASMFGRSLRWELREVNGSPAIAVSLPKDSTVAPDPLAPYIVTRSVDRRRFWTARLREARKAELEKALGPGFRLRWFESWLGRLRIALLNARATDIRLRIPEAWRVHRRILDWERDFSAQGVPIKAIGLDPLASILTRFLTRSWGRLDFANRFLAGTMLARIEMDLLPGLACAAHFAVFREGATGQHGAPAAIETGRRLQRFWLTATSLGVKVQPGLAPLAFAAYGRTGARFTLDAGVAAKAGRLAKALDEAFGPSPPVFLGRIGWGRTGDRASRSLRRRLGDLVIRPDAPPVEREPDRHMEPV